MKSIVLITKGGSVKTQKIKDMKLETIYKKCKFRNDNNFDKRHTWKLKKSFITIYAKDNGRAGQENKYDLPPPIDSVLYFGTIAIIHHEEEIPTDESIKDITKENWIKFYNKAMGGFDDLDEEEEEEEEEVIPKEFLSKQGYSKEDGFVVEDSDTQSTEKDEDISEEEFVDETDTDTSDKEENEEEDEEAIYGNESDCDFNEVEEVDDDDDEEDECEYENQEGGSELSEEEYNY